MMQWPTILLLACVAIATINAKHYNGYKVYQVKPRNEAQIKVLDEFRKNRNFDFWSRLHAPNHPISIMVPPKYQANFELSLKKNNIVHKILINDVERNVQIERHSRNIKPRVAPGDVSFTSYLQHAEINAYLARLAVDYPDIVKTEIIGQSYENRNITLIKISSGGESKPAILVDAGIHAREWIAPSVSLYIINQLVENPDNKALFEKVDWYIIPSLNPDGYQYTFDEDRFWRKTRSLGQFCDGVDPNRNFGFHWMEGGASDYECDETYAGTEAFSEKEAQALRDFVLKQENIKLYLTFHSYGPYLLYPWGYTSDLPDDWKELQTLAEDVNDAISAVDGTEYEIGTSTNTLYVAAGGSDDWCKGVGGVALSYTIELPGGGWFGFDLPEDRILPVVEETWEGVKVYQKYIEDKFAN